MLCYCNSKISTYWLKKVDIYYENLANGFVSAHKEEFSDKQIMIGFRKYVLNIGADKKYSGHRFYETIYTKLNDFSGHNKNKNGM